METSMGGGNTQVQYRILPPEKKTLWPGNTFREERADHSGHLAATQAQKRPVQMRRFALPRSFRVFRG